MEMHSNNDSKTIEKAADPIRYLPSEISISIIQAALPQDGTYPVHLMDLTNVSDRWRKFLFSTPTLWSQLYLDETIPDLLVLLAVSIERSGQTPLKLTIPGRPIHDWTRLVAVMGPFYHRVVHLAIIRAPQFVPFADGCIAALSTLFVHLGNPPNLTKIVFDERVTPSLTLFDSLKLPTAVQLVGKFSLERPRFPDSKNTTRIFNRVKFWSFVANRRADVHLFPLALSYDPYANVVGELMTSAKLTLGGNSAHHLERYSCFEQFIFTHSSNLASLAITVNLIDLRDLFDCLQLLPNLQVLYLDIDLHNWSSSPEITLRSVAYDTMKTLDVNVITDELDHDLLIALFGTMSHLYPRIENFVLKAQSWPPCITDYLKHIPALESLHLELETGNTINHSSPVYLPSLQALRIDGAFPPGFITTPNLLHLTVYDVFTSEKLTTLNALHLHKLVVSLRQAFDSDSDEAARYNIFLDPRAYPNLVELHLGLYGSIPSLQVSSFSQLTVIKLHSPQRVTNPLGAYLCLHFIYHPDHCPLLQELHSDRYVEWELLLLMLERRNFGPTGIKQIHIAAFPWIPFTLRSYLACLLAGESIEQSPPTSVSPEATREVIFDSGIPGCYSCLRNERPGCSEGIIETDKLWSSDKIYPELDISPNGIPPEVHGRLIQHEISVRKWKESYGACRFGREVACYRWWP